MPGFFALLGLAGVGVATGGASKFTPVFLGVSAALLARAYYLLYWRRHGSRLSLVLVWTATIVAAVLWATRLGLI